MRGNFRAVLNNSTIFILLVAFVFFVTPSGFAETDVSFSNRHTVRAATSGSDDSFYLTRAEAIIDYDSSRLGRTVKILPFFEYQHNLKTGAWWRKESGVEVGASFFNDCFYYGASFQHAWQRAENYSVELLEETTEWESRFEISPPIQWGIFRDKLILTLFEEYTYDFTRGQATFNEVGVIFDWQILEGVRLPFGWRHIDRVHDFDSDMLEFSLLLSF